MSYRNLLTDRCDVYHSKEQPVSDDSFGIPVDDLVKEYYYDETPDLIEEPCLFIEKNQSVVQGEPDQKIIQSMLVHFLTTADIRINAKANWEGVNYRLQKPRKIRNHHIEVIAVKDDSL